MSKYGRGLNREIVAAVNAGELQEPVCTRDVRELCESRGWGVTPAYLAVTLANAASDDHSPTYKKYFVRVSEGRYVVASTFKGGNWR